MINNRKIVFIVVAFFALVFSAFVAIGPFISLYGIRHSLKNDKEYLLEYFIDFKLLKENISIQIKKNIEKKYNVSLSQSDNSFEKMVKQVFVNMLEVSVEAAVSPSGIKYILLGEDLEQKLSINEESENNSSSTSNDKLLNIASYTDFLKENDFKYKDHEYFELIIKNNENKFYTLVFYRSGVLWKLINVELKENQMID